MTNYGSDDDLNRKVTGNLAPYSAVGTKSGAAIYFDLEPGKEVGAHTDSAEEIAYIVEVDGTIEATVGKKENDHLSPGISLS
jgi:quercetin dioxygenase-like cupin family protein